MENIMNVRTDAYAWHWPIFWQLGLVAEGGCVIVLAAVGVTPSLLAGSSASGNLGKSTEAGTVRMCPSSLCMSGALFGTIFGTDGSW